MEKILFMSENGEPAEFYILEQTRISGTDYILVTDTENDDGEALILKDISNPEEKDALYEIVEDNEELNAVAAVFSNMLEDVDLS